MGQQAQWEETHTGSDSGYLQIGNVQVNVGNVLTLASIVIPSLRAGQTTTIYRTVGEAERLSINAATRYTPPIGGVEGKYFYPSLEQARSMAQANYASQGAQTLTSVQVSRSFLQTVTPIAPLGEGPAFFLNSGQVSQLGSPAVWQYWPLH